jgi:hypothetical protein
MCLVKVIVVVNNFVKRVIRIPVFNVCNSVKKNKNRINFFSTSWRYQPVVQNRVFAKIGFFKNTKYFPVFFLLFFWPFETVCENSFFSVFFSVTLLWKLSRFPHE